jgi:eukaryotic-like serine/threonine-protein kinase
VDEHDDTGVDQASVTRALVDAGRRPRDAIAEHMHASVTAGLFGSSAEPSRIDRYVVLERVASGAIGTVVAAYDPKLDRKVALKLLRTRGSPAWRERLMREAKALARLSHPNVVAVYDAGTHDDEVYLAMELVEGVDVARWLADAPRSVVEVLEVFRQAGQGIVAAHAAGLVHRDIKPANILVGNDGRVRVADFGLSRTHADAIDEPVFGESTTLEGSTGSGAIVGTPAYMAPEQHEGEAATPRSDQFQFCVALWEGLFGERPFVAKDERALAAAKQRGPAETPSDRAVPEAIVVAIRRGLSPDPSRRFASLEELLAAIDVDPSRARRRATMIGIAVVAVGGIALASWWSRQPACTGAELRLAGVWDEPRRSALRDAFAASEAPFRERTAERTIAALDAHGARIVAAQQEACEATRVRGEHSEAVLDARSRCLGLRVHELGALVDELVRADADVMLRATTAAQSLAAPESCTREEGEVEVARPEVIAARERLADARARRSAGRYAAALELGRAVADEARELDDDALRAEALVIVAAAEQELGSPRDAEITLREAAVLARESGRPRIEARVWIDLLRSTENPRAPELTEFWSELARASLAAVGGDRKLEADLERNAGTALVAAGRYEAALAHHMRARELFEEVYGPASIAVANTDDSIGSALHSLGRHDESLGYHRAAAATLEQLLGPEHPYVGTAIANIGLELAAKDDLEAAAEEDRRALAIVEAALGRDHIKVAAISANYATVLARLGRSDEAVSRYEQAQRILAARLGADHPDALRVGANIGEQRLAQGDIAEADAIFRRTASGLAAALGPQHADVGVAHLNLARVLDREGRRSEAQVEADRAVAILEGALDQGHPFVAEAKRVAAELR